MCNSELISQTKYAGMVEQVKQITGLNADTSTLSIEFLPSVSDVKKLNTAHGISFYSVKENKIYVYKGVLRKVIYHEIAHALMQLYFNKNIPSGIVEIIPQWVEKQLRKTEQLWRNVWVG